MVAAVRSVAAMDDVAVVRSVAAVVGVAVVDDVVVVVGVVDAVAVWVQRCLMRPCTSSQFAFVSVVASRIGKELSWWDQ